MEIQPVVVGTAGHIDHGKSSLVRALTGIEPDRLKEERERGLTIDLGFANFELPDGRRVGVVDVPGHERFVKNMVAGATGIDLVVLVVAADDGVMPQTREHLSIMQTLEVERGLVALTKCDAVDEDLIELAEADVAEAVAGTFLADAPVLRVSSVTGAGLEAFRDALFALCAATTPRSASGIFRMPIQRVFSVQGFGTVVTGIPVGGTVETGDELELLPQGRRVKVRGVQAYGRDASRARAGHSSALNVTDVDATRVRRGHVVAAPGVFRASRWISVRVEGARDLPRPVRDRTRVRFHAGTADPHGELVLLDVEELEPGGSALAQLRLAEPVVVAPGDRFVLRLLSPERTLGGGVVLEESEHRLKRFKRFVIDGLEEAEQALDSPTRRLASTLRRRGARGASVEELASDLQQPRAELEALIDAAREEGSIELLPGGKRWIESGELGDGLERLQGAAAAWYAEHPLRLDVDAAELRTRSQLDRPTLDPLLQVASERGVAELRGGGRLRFHGVLPHTPAPALGELEKLAAQLECGGLRPPSVEELSTQLGLSAKRVNSLLERLQDEGRAVAVGPGLWFARAAFDRALEAVEENCRRNGELAIPELREVLDTTRKWLIPLLEHLDATGVTMRQGAHRVLRARD
ncbi:MAG: selenocysteine-specific translation elongation factor [Planctomycetota bacterium]